MLLKLFVAYPSVSKEGGSRLNVNSLLEIISMFLGGRKGASP